MSGPAEFPCDNARFVIDGPDGALEVLCACPDPAHARDVTAVICHPNPLQGGTLDNKVVHTVARAFNDLGARSLRFNFRGVGASAGRHTRGSGETDDAAAVLDWVRARRPHDALWLAGFSFGAYVALRAATRYPVAGLVTVSPPVNLYELQPLPLPKVPWIVIQGDADDVVPASAVEAWIERLQPRPHYVVINGAGHFFHRKLAELHAAVTETVRPHLHRGAPDS